MTLWYYLQEVTKLAAQVRQLYGSNMKSVSPVFLHLTGLDTNGRVYRECVRQSLDFNKLLVSKLVEVKWNCQFRFVLFECLEPHERNLLPRFLASSKADPATRLSFLRKPRRSNLFSNWTNQVVKLREFWLLMRESRNTRELRHLLQKTKTSLPWAGKTRNMYGLCCKK